MDYLFPCISGQNGLAALGVEFEEFEASLFGQSAGFERSIQTREVNEQLDKELDLFLIRLSPYLPLKSAQEALEWVIYRSFLNILLYKFDLVSMYMCFFHVVLLAEAYI